MVNITHKTSTLRIAVATGIVKVSRQETIDAIKNRTVPKGDVLEFSRAAGLLACKKTYEVIPDCHPLPVEYTSITHTLSGLEIQIRVEVHTVYKTGVEVEAMHGVAITALTLYDMLKPIDQEVEIRSIRLEEKKGGKTDRNHAMPATLKIAVITCSDSISEGTARDESGPLIIRMLQEHQLETSCHKLIPDDTGTIQETARQLVTEGYQLLLFTGGTGLSKRDSTPDALAPLIEREIPGIMEAARNYGQQRTPYAMLSRGIAGFIGNSLVLTLPGSPGGVRDSIQALFPHVLHLFKVKEGAKHE